MKKRSFTLVETIVSIVIMGVAAVTLVSLLANSTRQEIASGQSDILYKMLVIVRDIQGAYWDKQAYKNDTNASGYNVVNVLGSDLNCSSSYFFTGDKRRKCYDTNEINASAIVTDGNQSYVEGFEGFSYTDINNSVTYTTSVRYVDDTSCVRSGNRETCTWDFNASSGQTSNLQSTNLKRIIITGTRSVADENMSYTLYLFRSNIGESLHHVRN